MGKEFIGKRVRLQIGGEPTKDDKDKVIGQAVNVHVSAEDLKKYGSITAEKVELILGSDIDGAVRGIMSTVECSQEKNRDDILSTCRSILEAQDPHAKAKHIATLVAIGSGIASIAQFVLTLKSFAGL